MKKLRKSRGAGILLISALTLCVMLCGLFAPKLSELPSDSGYPKVNSSSPGNILLISSGNQCDFVFGQTKLIITQDTANIVKVSGKTAAGIDDLTIILTFGEKSYSLYSDASGNVSEQKFQLDIPYCQSIGNIFEINISYMIDGALFRSESGTMFGVVTYNPDNGALGYPEGAEYINIDGNRMPLTGISVPDDAMLDGKNGMTIICNGAEIYTIVGSSQYENVPDINDCLGDIYTKSSDSLTVYAAPGIEYSLSSDNLLISDWQTENNGLITFKGLQAGTVYTLVARTPASENKLPSVYISVIAHKTLDEALGAEKASFDKRFDELKDKLYDKESGILTASPQEITELSELYGGLSDEIKALPEVKEKGIIIEGSKYLSDNLLIINKPDEELSVSDKPALDQAIREYASLSEETKSYIGDRLTGLTEKEKAVALTELSQLVGNSAPSDKIQQMISDYKERIENAIILDGTETDAIISEAASEICNQAKTEGLGSLDALYNSIKDSAAYPSYSETVKLQIEEAYTSGRTAIENAADYLTVMAETEKALSSMLRIDGKEQLYDIINDSDPDNVKAIVDDAVKRIDEAETSEEIKEILTETKKEVLRQRGKNEIEDYISSLTIPQGKESLINDIKDNAYNAIDKLETAEDIALEVVRAKAELKLTEKYLELLDSIDENDPFTDAKERNLDSAYITALNEIRKATDESAIAAALEAGLKAMENAMGSAYLTDFYNKYKDILEKDEISADDLDIINKALSEIRTHSESEQDSFDEYRNNLLLKKMKAISVYLTECRDGYNDEVINGYILKIMTGNVDGDTASDNALSDTIDKLAEEAKLAIEFEKIKTDQKKAIEELAKDNEYLKPAYDKAISELDALVFSPDEAAENDNYFAETNNKAKEIFSRFKETVDFEVKREELKLAIKNDVDGKIASGKYSDSGIASLESKYSAAISALDGVEYSGADSIKLLEDIYSEHTALISAEKIVLLISGDCTVTNEGGMDSALSLSFKNSALKDINKSLISGGNYSVITGSMTEKQALEAISDKKTLLTFDISLMNGDTTVTGDGNGTYTVRILLPENLRSASGLQVVTMNDSGIEIFETRIDGNYLEFKTTHFSEFILLGDKEINLLWLAILFSVILVGELISGIIFNRKQKKNKNDKMYSIAAPFLAVLLTPSGILPAVIILGTLSVAGGAVLTHQVIKAKKSASSSNISDTNETAQSEAKIDEAANEGSDTSESFNAESTLTDTEKTNEAETEQTSEATSDTEAPDEPLKAETDVCLEEAPDETTYTDSTDNNEVSDEAFTLVNVETPDNENAGNSDEKPISEDSAQLVDVEAPEDSAEKAPEEKAFGSTRTVTIIDVEAPDTAESDTDEPEQSSEADNSPHEEYLRQDPAIDTDETAEEEAERRATAKIVNVYAAAQFTDDEEEEPESEGEPEDDDETDEAPIILPDDTEDETAVDRTVYASHGQRVYVTYDYSFESKLILSSEDTQRRYSYLSALLLSYKLGKRRSWKKERYFLKGKNYVQMIFRGKTLCLCMAILPESLENSKYFYENVGQIKKYESVPVMIRVRSGRGCKYAAELITMMMESAGIPQKYLPEDTFVPLEARDRDTLVSEGLIKRLMTDGNGDIVAADFEAMKSMKFTLESGMPVLKKVSAEDAALIPDEAAAEFVETEAEKDDEITYGRRKGIVNIDTISAAFNSGETVTLSALKAKHLVPKNIQFIKVLARGTLDKPLTVKAHDFSMDAVKMIVMAGGNAVKLKFIKVQ